MVFIFIMSSASGEESKEMSDSLFRMILNYLGLNIPSVVLRKSAHFLEFAGLCMATFNVLHVTFKLKKTFIWAFSFTAVYSITDEFHQIFSSGRAGRVSDILIDWAGALFGLAVAQIIYTMIKNRNERKKTDGNIKTI